MCVKNILIALIYDETILIMYLWISISLFSSSKYFKNEIIYIIAYNHTLPATILETFNIKLTSIH